jgi:PAT family beta-lactamase induction signal transducer AmpG
MEKARRLPPIWMMGLTNASFGLTGGFCAVVIPDMLASHGIPAGEVATITSLVLTPGFWAFLLAPMLDVRLRRRTYALIFGGFTAIAVAMAVVFSGRPHVVEAVMLPGFLAANLYQGAVGGWMGSLISREQDSALGIWFSVSNLGAGGLMMVLAGVVLNRYSPAVSGMLLGILILLPMAFFVAIPSPEPDRQLARESFDRFFTEVGSLLRRREVVFALLLFIFPAASFALTNVLGGAGGDFAASEREVSLLAGVGSTIAGLVGSFLLFPLARKMALRPLYLVIGSVGALFTLSLMLLPRRPWSFAVAISGENLFQALAFSTGNAINFEVIGPNNPLAATLFTLLISATNLPIVYMQYLDGRGYDRGGLIGSYTTDACISIAACTLLAWLLTRWRGRSRTAAPTIEALSKSAE